MELFISSPLFISVMPSRKMSGIDRHTVNANFGFVLQSIQGLACRPLKLETALCTSQDGEYSREASKKLSFNFCLRKAVQDASCRPAPVIGKSLCETI